MVNHEGLVHWFPQCEYRSACLLNVREYPYDKHSCDMWFQPMAIHSHYLRLEAYDRSPWDLVSKFYTKTIRIKYVK